MFQIHSPDFVYVTRATHSIPFQDIGTSNHTHSHTATYPPALAAAFVPGPQDAAKPSHALQHHFHVLGTFHLLRVQS